MSDTIDVNFDKPKTSQRQEPRPGGHPEGIGFGKPWVAPPLTFKAGGFFVQSLVTESALVAVELAGGWLGMIEEETIAFIAHAEVARELGQLLIEAADAAEDERA